MRFGLLIGFWLCALAVTFRVEEVRVVRDISYLGPDSRLKLDLYEPAPDAKKVAGVPRGVGVDGSFGDRPAATIFRPAPTLSPSGKTAGSDGQGKRGREPMLCPKISRARS
jgi:hypothetical protein